MKSTVLRELVAAAQKDYLYWQSIRDETTTSDVHNAIAFYAQFFEQISNGLNSVYPYHAAEQYIARYHERIHFFALQEQEFAPAADRLVEEMVTSGYSPVANLNQEQVSATIQQKWKRWYFLLDRLSAQDFKRYKQIIFQVITYDITSVFHPGSLDARLLEAYTQQFTTDADLYAFYSLLGEALRLPESFVRYLFWKASFPSDWDSADDPEQIKSFKPQLQQIIRTSAEKTGGLKSFRSFISAQKKYVTVTYQQSLKLIPAYQEAVETLQSLLTPSVITGDQNARDQFAAHAVTRLTALAGNPIQAFDEASVMQYLVEKVKRWQHLLLDEQKRVCISFMAHDMLRVFYERDLDTYLIATCQYQQLNEESILRIIAGRSLKYSDTFISYILFTRRFQKWQDSFDLSQADTLSPQFLAALQHVEFAFTTFEKLPKNRYAGLMKNYTAFFAVKKIIEVYFEGKDAVGSPRERLEELYRQLAKSKAKEDATADEISVYLKEYLTKKPKVLSESTFDEALYCILWQAVQTSESKELTPLLEDDATRDEYLQLIYYRFDAYTFNRIMATNYAGLANLFGTKGFIILIEAYLIGSGIEHVINYFVEGSVGTVYSIFANLPFADGSFVSPKLMETFNTSFNFALNAFNEGWLQMDWGKTFLSLLIPIILMFLITSYNYAFFKLNREDNRDRSFKRLSASIKRWIEKKTIRVNLTRKREFSIFFESFKAFLLLLETFYIIAILYALGFAPTQIALFFFLLSTICLSAYQGNKLKDEVTLGTSETISDTVRDFIFIPIIELGKFLGGQAKSINFIPWLVKTGVEPLYRFVIRIFQSFISFQREKKEEII